jgi:hypothetical protein
MNPNRMGNAPLRRFGRVFSLAVLLPIAGPLNLCEGPTEPADTSAPSVIITSPADQSTVSERVTVTCAATDDRGIVLVMLWIDGHALSGAEDVTAPYEMTWNTSGCVNGSVHSLTVSAFDAEGNQTASRPVRVVVDNSLSYPSAVAIQSVLFENGAWRIQWDKSPDADFASYTLLGSASREMDRTIPLFTTTDRDRTEYTMNGVREGDVLYLRIVVKDSMDFSTAGPVKTALTENGRIPTLGLVAFYPFNGNEVDESGKSNHGRASGVTYGADRTGQPNAACRFDGLDDFITVDEDASLESDDFTVACWMKTLSLETDTYQTLVIKEDGWNDGYKVVLRTELNDERARTVLFTVSGPESDYETMVNLHSTYRIPAAGAWTHVAVTYRHGGDMRIYIDGVLDARTAGPPSWDRANSYELVIGRHSNNGGTSYGGYFQGAMDDLMIYNRELGEREIESIFMGQW